MEFFWEKNELLSLLIFFYIAMNLSLWLNSKNTLAEFIQQYMWILRRYLNLNLFEQKRICTGFLFSFVGIVLPLEIGLQCAIWWLMFPRIQLHMGVMYVFCYASFWKINMSPNIIENILLIWLRKTQKHVLTIYFSSIKGTPGWQQVAIWYDLIYHILKTNSEHSSCLRLAVFMFSMHFSWESHSTVFYEYVS